VTGQGRADSVPAAEDAVRKIQRLKKAIGRSRAQLTVEQPGADVVAGGSALATELREWEEQLEAVRCDMAELLAERDRWRIAHDKLRERLDRHTLEPRSEPQRAAQSAPQPPRARPSGESQDFTAIDRELERLNASMLRAFSSE
jgi:regulator of replication initiation timing